MIICKNHHSDIMKRINIITYYNANNHGAFLQAYALMKFLKGNGYQVRFKGMEITPQVTADEYTAKLNSILVNSQKILPINWSNEKYDVSVVGSDEVFNFNNITYGKFTYFDGSGLNSDKVVSYAASMGAASYKKLLLKKFFRYCKLRNFDVISVRDKRTEYFVRKFYNKKITRDVDPTLLVDFDQELIKPSFEHYLIVYTYGMKAEHIEFIRKFATEKNLQIIATGSYCDWSDLNLAVSPFEWIGLIKYADYVFTSTFHGTIFSLKYKKQFLALVKDAKKVKELLENIHLENRYCQTTNEGELMSIIGAVIDYSSINLDDSIADSSRNLLDSLL